MMLRLEKSRLSTVIAASKRARQIIGGADPVRQDSNQKKPLSVAVEELYHGDVKILSDEEEREPDM